MKETTITSTPKPKIVRFNNWWSSRSLVQQFALAGSIVLVCGMAVIGSWVSKEIEHAVTNNAGASTALYMNSFIAPHLQELGQINILSKESQAAVDEMLIGTEIGKRVISAKVWKEGGLIAYSSRKSIIGQVFPPTPNLKRAWQGDIAAEFDKLEDEEDALERSSGLPILEIYSPIREVYTGRIIAVAEFYARADSLKDDLIDAQLSSWVVVGLVTLAMIGLLSGIVRKGSQTIVNQRSSLQERVEQLSILRDQIERSSRISTELNERFLRRIGSDLHDGPAQLIGLALVRLDSLAVSDGKESSIETEAGKDVELVRGALDDALAEIRNLSAGLVLPEFESHTLAKGLLKVITIHEQRTQTTIYKDIGELPTQMNKSIKISLYRMVQEGLNNAFHYAREAQVKVKAHYDGSVIEVRISDNGPGFDATISHENNSGLGLPGLRERIESIGGSFEVHSNTEEGTTLSSRFIIGEVG